MAQSNSDLLDLLARALAGSKIAAEKLFKQLAPTIREAVVCTLFLTNVRHSRARSDPDRVEECMQDTYEEIVQNDMAVLRRFNPDVPPGNLEAFVYGIARNVTRSRIRPRKSDRLEVATPDDDMQDLAHLAPDPEQMALIRDELDLVLSNLHLDAENEELFVRHFVDEIPGQDIYEEIGWTGTAFWKWASRIREKCRTILKKRSGGNKGGTNE